MSWSAPTISKGQGFYDAVLGTLGVRRAKVDGNRIFYFAKTGAFAVSKPINGELATFANGGTSASRPNPPEQAMHGTRPGSPTAGRPAKTRRACAKGGRQNVSRLFARSDGNKICAMHRITGIDRRIPRVE